MAGKEDTEQTTPWIILEMHFYKNSRGRVPDSIDVRSRDKNWPEGTRKLFPKEMILVIDLRNREELVNSWQVELVK